MQNLDPDHLDDITSRLNALRLSNGGGFSRNSSPPIASAPPLTAPSSEVDSNELLESQRLINGNSYNGTGHLNDIYVPQQTQHVHLEIPTDQQIAYPDFSQFQNPQQSHQMNERQRQITTLQTQQAQQAQIAQYQSQMASQTEIIQQTQTTPQAHLMQQQTYYPPQHWSHLPEYQQSYVGSPPPDKQEHHPYGLTNENSRSYSPPGTVITRHGKTPVKVIGGSSMRREIKEIQREQEYQKHQVAVSQWQNVIKSSVNKQLENDYKNAERFICEIKKQIEIPENFNILLREISLHVGRTIRVGDQKFHSGVKTPSIPISDEFRQKRWMKCEMKYIEEAIKDFNKLPNNKDIVKIIIRFQKNTGVINFIGFEILDNELKCLVLSKKTGGKWNGTKYYET